MKSGYGGVWSGGEVEDEVLVRLVPTRPSERVTYRGGNSLDCVAWFCFVVGRCG